MDAETLIRTLELQPHPEGGHFRETFRHSPPEGGRGAMTAIYYLLRAGEVSHWHRVDAAEIWHWYGGASLALSIAGTGEKPSTRHLGPAIDREERPQILVPAGAWQSARSLGDWTLVGCTVGPGFDFDGFELAPPDWQPNQGP